MKTIMRKSYAILMAIVCLLPIFTSCEEDVTTTYTYVASARSTYPTDQTSKAIAQAIIDYQTKAGILGTPFNKSVDKEDLTNEELEKLDKEAAAEVLTRLSNCNFAQIVKEAGITVPDGQQTIQIIYAVGWPATDGTIVERSNARLDIAPDVLK